MAADLHVALLEHVEQSHLDPLGQVGELVHGEDPAVEPGNQPVVDGQLVGEVPALGHRMGSTSPMRSAIEVSGVASFSP